MRVKGHGPAMHEARTSRYSWSGPASRFTDPVEAFHSPSGEQGACRLQGTLPWFTTWNVLTALPMLVSPCELTVWRMRMLDTTDSFLFARAGGSGRTGVSAAT